MVNGDFELSFTYKVKDRLDIPGGSFACCYFNTLGQGTGKWIEAVPSWRRVTPSDEVYADHARGLRFSFATHNPDQPDIDHRLRLRWFNKTPTLTLVEPASPAVFPFTDGLAYEMTVRRTGDRLGVSVVPPAGQPRGAAVLRLGGRRHRPLVERPRGLPLAGSGRRDHQHLADGTRSAAVQARGGSGWHGSSLALRDHRFAQIPPTIVSAPVGSILTLTVVRFS